jgi:hypothetical protein
MPPVPSWRVRRRPSSRPDAQQQWDRAYQHLLQGTQPPQARQPRLRAASPTAFQEEEQTDDDRDVCTRLQSAPRPDPID